jgi:hypothetical protein
MSRGMISDKELTVEARVSDWVTGIVFLRMAVSVNLGSKPSAVPMHVMRRDYARLRNRLKQVIVSVLPLNPRCNWHNEAGIKLAEIRTAATRIGIKRRELK